MQYCFKRLFESFWCPFVFFKGSRVKTGRYCAASWRALVVAQGPNEIRPLCVLQTRQCAWTDIKKGSFMSRLSNRSFNSDLENAVEGGGGGGGGGEDIARTIQKPSGLILYGNGNEKKRGLTLPCVCSPHPGWDGGLSSRGLLLDAWEEALCFDVVSQKYSFWTVGNGEKRGNERGGG